MKPTNYVNNTNAAGGKGWYLGVADGKVFGNGLLCSTSNTLTHKGKADKDTSGQWLVGLYVMFPALLTRKIFPAAPEPPRAESKGARDPHLTPGLKIKLVHVSGQAALPDTYIVEKAEGRKQFDGIINRLSCGVSLIFAANQYRFALENETDRHLRIEPEGAVTNDGATGPLATWIVEVKEDGKGLCSFRLI